jgi:glycosyltransferase involved in cell wall biosynthesis
MRACGWLGAPVLVASLHGYDLTRVQRDFDYRFLPGWTDVVLVTTQFMRDKAMVLGCKGQQVKTFTLGVDTARFQPAVAISEEVVPTILTVARLVKQKGLSYGLQALRRLHDAGTACRYQVIGDGPERGALLREAQALGVQEAVTWEGAQPVARVRQAMQRAAVFLFPTVRMPAGDEEAQGVVLLESQASGAPVIATRCGGVPEVVAPTMWLVDERDVDGLVRCLDEVLCMSAEQRRQRGLDARAWVERHFAMSAQWQVLEGFYRDALEGGRRCP